MWIFMISCYLLTGCSLLLFILTGIQGYFQFPVFGLNHPALALLTASIYLFTESLITFFFVGAGADIKQYMAEGLAEETDYNQSILIKKKLYPPTMLNPSGNNCFYYRWCSRYKYFPLMASWASLCNYFGPFFKNDKNSEFMFQRNGGHQD
jgi:hypothetical protein